MYIHIFHATYSNYANPQSRYYKMNFPLMIDDYPKSSSEITYMTHM